MIRKVKYKEHIITYELQRKNVKNVNLRIKPDSSVAVSANRYVSTKFIDEFVIRNAEYILSVLKRFSESENIENKPNFSNEAFIQYVKKCFNEVYFLFKDKIREKPVLKLKTMTSRWGSCNFEKYIITINSNLIYCEERHIYYVMVHEFAHFLVHNHSKDFYNVVQKYCKEYKQINKELNKMHIKRS